jgi:hypothetical protein
MDFRKHQIDGQEFGYYQTPGLDTNLSGKSHLLLSQLPIMDRSF